MILTDELTHEQASPIHHLKEPPRSIGRSPRKRGDIALFCAAILVFAGVAFVMRLPGADTNGRDTYNVITRLARTLTYTLSRTPGQPVLDYCNYVFWSFGGDLAVQAWFVWMSAAGVTALYLLVRELGGASPLLAVLTLALNPFFLTHVGGVGDFAVSNSLLIISLLFASRVKPSAAGAALAVAVGCRLVFCLYVIPVSVLVVLAAHAKGASVRQCVRAGATATAVAALLSIIEYGPSFSFWGRDLLHNLSYQGMKYHASAFLFKLFVSLGAPVWVLLAGLGISLVRRGRKCRALCTNPAAVMVGMLIILCCMVYFFRVPTKPELTLPILIGIILLMQFCSSSKWALALMLGSVSIGWVVLSPYDRGQDRHQWHFEDGWYSRNYQEAYQNRFHLEIVRSFLAALPPRTLLITERQWTIEHSERSDVEMVTRLAGVELKAASAFHGLGADRVIVDPQEGNLAELLESVATKASPDYRMTVFYEKTYLGLLRRWQHLDLAQYGHPVVLRHER
jgi:hypothetical protein